MAKHQGKEHRFLFVRADGMQLEKITHIVETTKIVPQINSTWALHIKIVNAKKLLQVFAIFLNSFSILIGSGYSWFRCRFIAFGNAGRHYYPYRIFLQWAFRSSAYSFCAFEKALKDF